MMRLREIIKNIKNWQVDLSDSLVQLFSTRLCTFLGLDIDFDASTSLSVGRDLINWFDDYSWKTNRAHLPPHMPASFSLTESVYPGNTLSETVRHLTSSVSDSLSAELICLMLLVYIYKSLATSFHLCAGCVYHMIHTFHWGFLYILYPHFFFLAESFRNVVDSLNSSNNENTTLTLVYTKSIQ